MKITKFGHCCLLIEENGLRVLIDPGIFSTSQNEVKNIDVVLITHEHPDHLDPNSLKTILKNNPGTKVKTNKSVGAILEKEGISYQLLEDGQSIVENGISIEGIGNKHGQFHSTIPPIQNTGYVIANRFFYPGDSVAFRGREFEILALPVVGPWSKMWEVLDFALAVKPKICFPVHEAIFKEPQIAYRWPTQVLPPAGISFQVLDLGKEYKF